MEREKAKSADEEFWERGSLWDGYCIGLERRRRGGKLGCGQASYYGVAEYGLLFGGEDWVLNGWC